MEYYAAERKKEFLPFVTAWMELESIILSEVSHVVKDKYHMISAISGTYSTKQTNTQNITKDTEIENRPTVTRGERRGNLRGKGGRVCRNNCEGRMDNNKKWWKQGRKVGRAGVGGKAEKCT